MRVLERLAGLDLDAVALNLHHGGELIARVVGDGPVFLHEEWLRGTAGALAGAAGFLGDDDFLVASADGAHEVNLAGLITRHRESGAAATITVKRIARPETCAVVALDDAGLVTRFVEKPGAGEVFTDLASIGIYCVTPAVLGLVPADRPYDIAGELMPALLAAGLPVAAYETDAWWSDIGDPGELLAANLRVAARREGGANASGTAIAEPSEITPDALIAEPSEIAPDALIAEAMIGPHSRIGSGAVVRRSLVLPGAAVAPGAVIEDAIHGTGDDVVKAWLR